MVSKVKLIFGGAFVDQSFSNLDFINKVLDTIKAGGVESIDTARTYGNSEELLGLVSAASHFNIQTKLPGGFGPQPSTKELLISTTEQSLRTLKTNQVDILYLHAPDRRTSLEGQLEAFNQLHQAGKFKRFGLSNFLANEVDEVVRICHEKNYALPTVYQGNYSPVARRAENDILPTLRKHNMSFYAYSPIAGGFLTKAVETLVAGGDGRWDQTTAMGGLYNALYNKPSMLKGLKLWEEISNDSGIAKAEIAYRWVAYNSDLKGELGDGLIFGARTLEQVNQTLAGLERGPLPSHIAERIENVWKIVLPDAPVDNFHSYAEKRNE
ncbi:Aldo/keto reductase subgroup [Penicillium longicatenatum]|nr:Aldo/keto reductase subgroup [Penicillium longicatenatum]